MAKMITSLQNPLVKHLVRLHSNRDYREEQRSVLVSGFKIVSELCAQKKARNVLISDPADLPEPINAENTYIVSHEIIKKISGLEAPEGIVAEVEMPLPSTLNKMKWIVACDAISDPGNMGTIFRTALGLGWQGIFLLPNSCDPFNDKAIRAAKGATFRMPYRQGSWMELKELIAQNRLNPFVADMQGQKVDQLENQNSGLLLLNSEAHGISEEGRELCQPVSVPLVGPMESLNVAIAGGILMYLLRSTCSRGIAQPQT